MAESMLQISVARRAAEALGIPVSGALLLGVIAPDSVRMRSDATREDYLRVHSLTQDWSDTYRAARRLMESEGDDLYLLGCAFHLMTDSLWAAYRRELADRIPGDLTDEEKNALLRRETDVLEHVLYLREDGRTLFQAILSTPLKEDRGYLGLSSVNVDAWRRRCSQVLAGMKQSDSALTVLNTQAVDLFLDRASARIAREYRKAREEAGK